MLNPRCKLPVAQTLRSSGWQPYCHSYLRKTIPWHHLVGYLRGKKIITLYLSSVLPYKNWGEAGSTSPVPAGPAPPAHGARRWQAVTALLGCAAAPRVVLFFSLFSLWWKVLACCSGIWYDVYSLVRYWAWPATYIMQLLRVANFSACLEAPGRWTNDHWHVFEAFKHPVFIERNSYLLHYCDRKFTNL